MTQHRTQASATINGVQNNTCDRSHSFLLLGFDSLSSSAYRDGFMVLVGVSGSADAPLVNAAQNTKKGTYDGYIYAYNVSGRLL